MAPRTHVLGRRTVAFLIDLVLVVAVCFLFILGQGGGTVAMRRHLGRTALWVIDGFPYFLPGALAFICALCSPGRQRIGDFVARTLVVAREP